MSTQTSITSLIVGAINTNEDQVSINVNCDPENNQVSESNSFVYAKSEVLIPKNEKDLMPLSGGSVLRIIPSNSKYYIKKQDSYLAKIDSINQKIVSKYLEDDKSVSKDILFSSYKQLADIRLAINRVFYETSNFLKSTENFYDKDGVPEFILSTIYSPLSADELQKTYNDNKAANIRVKDTLPFLSLQFIPFEVILKICQILSVKEEERGTGTFINSLGISFLEMYEKLKEVSESESQGDTEAINIMASTILEVFPYYRIGEEVIISEPDDKLQLGGFFTFFGSNFYIKMPDLSGRDSSEYYSNFITQENDSIKESLFYVLEILAKEKDTYEYCPVVLKYNQLPSLTLKDGEISYPDESGLQSDDQIVYTGLDSIYIENVGKNGLNNFKQKYYLSPLIKSENPNNNIIKSANGKALDRRLEINYSQPIEVTTIPVDYRFKFFTKEEKDSNDLIKKYGAIPLFEKGTAKYGVSSIDTYLSAINRPEIIITDRENSDTVDAREISFYSTQQTYTRYAISGSTPRFLFNIPKNGSSIDYSNSFYPITNPSVSLPKHWIEMTHSQSEDDKSDVILKFSSSGKQKLRELFLTTEKQSADDEKYFNITDEGKKISFATYVFDDVTGQFTRLPGPNINITLGSPVIKEIKPDGYYGGEPLRSGDYISIEIIGENLAETKLVYMATGGTRDRLIAGVGDDGFSVSNNSIKIKSTEKKWSDITTNIGEFPVYIKTSSKESNKDVKIYISDNFATSLTIPSKGASDINFLSLNSIYYQPIGKPKGLEASTINSRGPDSIPVLFSGNNIKLKFGSTNNLFVTQNENNIFAYLAFKKENSQKLVETFGLKEDVITINVDGEKYYTNKKIVWKFGDPSFLRSKLSNFAELSFPGPFESGPFNARTLIEGDLKPQEAYLIFSNQIITSDYSPNINVVSGYYPVSILKIGSMDEEKPAFINPPHVLGLIVRSDKGRECTANFDTSEISGSNKASGNLQYRIKKAIPLRMASETDLTNIIYGKISVQNTIDHLFVLFNAPKKNKKYYKDCYRFFIGSRDITGKISGRVKYLSNNIACAYFRGISSVKINGPSEFTISVNDYEYSSTYNSILYTRVSKRLAKDSYEITENEDGRVVKIKDLNSRRVETYSGFKQISENLVLPINNTIGLVKYQKYGYSKDSTSIKTALSGGNNQKDLYTAFVSPIKIRPINLEITFGNIESTTDESQASLIYGAFLSDGSVKNGSLEENVIVANSNTIDIIRSKVDAIAIGEAVISAATEIVSNITSRNNEISSDPNSSSAEVGITVESDSSLIDLTGAIDSLKSIISDVNSTAKMITDAVDQINQLSAKASALADKLSSANFSLSDTIDSLVDSNIGPNGRSTLINKINQYYTYIQEEFGYSDSFVSESNSKEELFVIIKTSIRNSHIIEAKVPEIISIEVKESDGSETIYTRENFSTLKIGSSPIKAIIRVIAGDKNSKFELGGYRLSTNFLKKDGDEYIYDVVIEPSIFTLIFSGSDCAKISVTNSNRDRLKVEVALDPTAGQDFDKFFDRAKSSIDKQSKRILDEITEKKGKLKVGPVLYDKALAAKELLKSFCDMSFHLTAEVSAQLKFLKILYIPIKVIFCIIDVICALLHPVKLAFAVIRLFACLFDLILLLPQISMPVLFLTIALHILELLLCVIHKILGIIVGINEIITALDTAVRRRDFESIKNLELALNEHLLTIEADLQVIEPIIQILGLILELLQLIFAFPCQITQDEDEPACIDPSMLAGLIVSKVAPKGVIVPDAMIPLAQDYTNLPVDRTGENGNTPDSENSDPEEIIDVDYKSPPRDASGNRITNVLFKVPEAIDNGKITVINDNSSFGGRILPDLVDSDTNENKKVIDGGFFSGDSNGDNFIDNINYGKLRFKGGEFDASFGISCTKSKKRFSFGTTFDQKNDPRFVEFQFKSAGLTSDFAWITFVGIFFKKKIIDDLFTLDSPPAMLKKNGTSLEIHKGSSIDEDNIKLISPIDGFSNFIEYAGPGPGDTLTYKATPLVADIDVIESTVDPDTGLPITEIRTVTKTFGGIPSFAIVDEKFNVYFIEENGLSIRFDEINGIKYPVIDNIFAKMINFPAAETQRFDREERQVIRKTAAYYQKKGLFKSQMVDSLLEYCSNGNPRSENFNTGYKKELGDAILKMQANAAYFEGLSSSIFLDIERTSSPSWIEKDNDTTIFGSSKPIALIGEPAADPPVPFTIYINFKKLNSELFAQDGVGISDTSGYIGVNGAKRFSEYLKGLVSDPNNIVFEFPYPEVGVYDFANGTWAENDDFQYAINTIDVYNFPQIHLVDLRQVADDIAAACGTSQTNQLLLDMPGFTLDFAGDVVQPYLSCITDFRDIFVGNKGIVTKIRDSLSTGKIPESIPVGDITAAYNNLVDCTNKAIDDACKFVVNPLNTTFKLIEDLDQTDLDGFIDPSGLITEVITDGAVSSMPTITGAMEYASGIGDSATVQAGKKVAIQVIPRDSYDDEIIDTLDAREKIAVTIVSDTTATGAYLEKVDPSQEKLWSKNGSVYTVNIKSKTPGKVTIKASFCNVTIQAVTDRGIQITNPDNTSPDCIPDVNSSDTSEVFPPGALVKVDRILTILFTANQIVDSIDDSGAGAASIGPQVVFTDMVN